MPTTVTRNRKATGLGRMIKARPEAARFIERIAKTRRLKFNSVLDILIAGFQKLTPDQQAEAFGDQPVKGGGK